jgi:predicted nuclease with TOPRIM domain
MLLCNRALMSIFFVIHNTIVWAGQNNSKQQKKQMGVAHSLLSNQIQLSDRLENNHDFVRSLFKEILKHDQQFIDLKDDFTEKYTDFLLHEGTLIEQNKELKTKVELLENKLTLLTKKITAIEEKIEKKK